MSSTGLGGDARFGALVKDSTRVSTGCDNHSVAGAAYKLAHRRFLRLRMKHRYAQQVQMLIFILVAGRILFEL